MVSYQIKTWKSFLHLNTLIFVPVFECFQIVLWKHRKRDVTTVFSYSHLNTPVGQSERAYYLSYFIKCHIRNRSTNPIAGNSLFSSEIILKHYINDNNLPCVSQNIFRIALLVLILSRETIFFVQDTDNNSELYTNLLLIL